MRGLLYVVRLALQFGGFEVATLAEALASGRLDDFAAQSQAQGIGIVDRAGPPAIRTLG